MAKYCMKSDFYCKKVFHDVLNHTCQTKERLHKKDQNQAGKQYVVLANLSYRNLDISFFYSSIGPNAAAAQSATSTLCTSDYVEVIFAFVQNQTQYAL